MMRSAVRWSGVLAAGIVLALVANPVWSQSVTTGSVTGIVLLPDGTPSPGVAVSFRCGGRGAGRSLEIPVHRP